MKALLQRVKSSSVAVDDCVIGKIGAGFLLFLGVAVGDNEKDADYLVDKIANLRVFSDGDGKFNLSVLQVAGQVLVISQFTLLADTRKGRRPSFTDAAPPQIAEALYLYVISKLKGIGLTVESGKFAAHMQVAIINDGPVTILLDSTDMPHI